MANKGIDAKEKYYEDSIGTIGNVFVNLCNTNKQVLVQLNTFTSKLSNLLNLSFVYIPNTNKFYNNYFQKLSNLEEVNPRTAHRAM